MPDCYGVLNLHAKLTIKKMSCNFNSLYVVNLNLNLFSVTQPLTDHNFGTVNSVARCNFNQFSFSPQSVAFTHAGSHIHIGASFSHDDDTLRFIK